MNAYEYALGKWDNSPSQELLTACKSIDELTLLQQCLVHKTKYSEQHLYAYIFESDAYFEPAEKWGRLYLSSLRKLETLVKKNELANRT